ncbi:endonuclease/exonuclease/phosphatase family protein [soil metagenome]
MSFNIRGSYHRDGANSWKYRAKLSADVIKHYAPNLIGFQEFQSGNRKTYDEELPDYNYRLGPEYEDFPPRAHNAIYWDPQRLVLLESGGFWLSGTPEKFSGSWGTHQKRSANWAWFRDASTGVEFVHLNTHLDHKCVEARRRGAMLIVRRLDGLTERRLPTLITGDFNAEPGSPVHRIFTDAGFDDARLKAGNPPARTFHKFRGDGFVTSRPEREGRLDWVLLRDGLGEMRGEGVSCRVARDAEPPVYPSDHYPVVADIRFLDAASTGQLT